MTDRLRGIPTTDRIRVDPASSLAERGAMLAEPANQQIVGQRRKVADRPDAVFAERDRRFGADAPQPGDGQRFQEDRLLAGRDDDEAVRLPEV